MDPNTARQVLRLSPDAPLTPSTIEAAFARESWERHPSRYPDAAGRAAADEWAATLAEARTVLLRSTPPEVASWVPPTAGPVPVPAPGPQASGESELSPTVASAPTGAPAPGDAARFRRRRRIALIGGIAAASAGVVALLVAAVFGATRLAEQLADEAAVLAEDPAWTGETIRYSAGETLFTFPAAMEEYTDGRYWEECPDQFGGACWQMAIIPEDACTSLEVDLEFTDDESAWSGDEQQTLAFRDAAAGTAIPVVFGHDDYDWAWIADVRCLDEPVASTEGPSTTSSAVTTPMGRLEAGRWASADTGFYAAASLEFHDDGRLDELCPDGFVRGCWQATLVPEENCGSLRIQYTLRAADGSELEKATWRMAEAGKRVHVVFGNDEYEHGWISHVVCGA